MTLVAAHNGAGMPDMSVSVRQVFGIDTDLEVPAYSRPDEHVPDVDADYLFNKDVTLAVLAGFKHNRRVMIQGYHGTGKSTHIEQVAARLNWPCIRINLDSHVSRIDLVGKDAIVIRDGMQITEFREGILPYALQFLRGLPGVLDGLGHHLLALLEREQQRLPGKLRQQPR